MLVAGGNAIAEETDKPLVEFRSSKVTVEFKVYRFWDSRFSTLCYANQNSMHCIPYSDLTSNAQKRLRKMVENNKSEIIKLNEVSKEGGENL